MSHSSLGVTLVTLVMVATLATLVTGVACFVDEGPQASSSSTVGVTTSTSGEPTSAGSTEGSTAGSTTGSTTALETATSTGSDTGAPVQVYSCPAVAGLLLCYEFEDGWGDDLLLDTSTSPLHGTMVGVDRVAGHSGSAALFSETSEVFVNYQKTVVDQLASGFTVAAWIQPTSGMNPGSRGIIERDGHLLLGIQGVEGSDDLYQVSCGGGGGDSGVTIASTVSLESGAWAHVACVYDGMTLSVWVNGALEGEAGVEIGFLGDDRLWIGNDGPTAPEKAFVGLIDEVQIWSVPLVGQALCGAAGIADCSM